MNQEATCEVKYTEVSDPAVMMLAPIVSVHMITYNHGPYLAEAIEGVIAQKTDFPIELVIGEDCSTDNTREIALDYQRRYPHLIRVIYPDQNVGMHRNFRQVNDACRGEFIAYCEGDDYWVDPDKLREQAAVLTRLKNIDITFHSCYIKSEKQQTKALSHVHSSTDKLFTLSDVIDGDIHFVMGFMPTTSIMVRRSLIMSIQDWFDAKISPVGDHIVEVFGARNGAYYINRPMSVYRREANGSWSERMKNDPDACVEMHLQFLSMLMRLKQAIPEQEEAFLRRITYSCAHLSKIGTDKNFTQIKESILPILKDIYRPKAINEHSIGSEQWEEALFTKLAVDCGKTKDFADQQCGVLRQFCRVVKSAFDYEVLILQMIKTNHSNSSDCERQIAKWKVEEQSSYLFARWKRFRKLIIEKVRLVLKATTSTFLARQKC
ncbi:glycosyltransferase [Methylobacter sp. YRD-M1]|uniref:glycosyltransferase n=1 Tax=Methylobacter sp. YRD-M1 TaxID=2911520 RepID=UPI00227C1286|nr:glycosyltransferase [Methylobacter sp. YRD-M1]WAK00568.1 glycosyltransferase [Methylobacter sp. YRD-M1]